jgi:hypothetical protein
MESSESLSKRPDPDSPWLQPQAVVHKDGTMTPAKPPAKPKPPSTATEKPSA